MPAYCKPYYYIECFRIVKGYLKFFRTFSFFFLGRTAQRVFCRLAFWFPRLYDMHKGRCPHILFLWRYGQMKRMKSRRLLALGLSLVLAFS